LTGDWCSFFMGRPNRLSAVRCAALLKMGTSRRVGPSWISGGTGKKLHQSPVKQFALEHGLAIHQPTRIKTPEARELFASHPADAAIVVAYGRILPPEFLDAHSTWLHQCSLLAAAKVFAARRR